MTNEFEPKLITVLREGVSRPQWFKEISAGVVVGIVALPLAIAFAIASGVKPEQGLYTAIIAGFIISAFGGSRVQVGGPTGAFIVIVYGIVQKFGYEGLAVATMLAGGLLIVMGVMRLGTVISFIPYPITVGFTAGIAIIIFVTQIRDFLGLPQTALPAELPGKIEFIARHVGELNLAALALGVLSLAIVILFPKFTKVPGSIVAILVCTALAQLFALPVATIGSVFGAVPSSLPEMRLPVIDWNTIGALINPAVSIALLAAIESLLSAVVADGMTGRRHRSNMELVAQGFANIASPLFGGIPATGAIARTATNVKSGGRTPIAGIVHAATLLLIMLLFGQWAALIPLPVLAAILMSVAIKMGEWRLMLHIFRSTTSDVLVMLSTFALTIFIDLSVAIEVGMVLAALLFMKRMADVSSSTPDVVSQVIEPPDVETAVSRPVDAAAVPERVEVFEVAGPFFFGAVDKFKNAIQRVERRPKVLILRMRAVPALDATGLLALEEVFERTRAEGSILLISGLQEQPRQVLKKSGLLDKIGEQNLPEHIGLALARARDVLKQQER